MGAGYFSGFKFNISNRLPDTEVVEYEKRLTMVEQWKRWGLNLWRYKETEMATKRVRTKKGQCFRIGETIFISPKDYSLVKDMIA
jgi:hypothetical protein